MAKSSAQLDREIADALQSRVELVIDDTYRPWRELQIRALDNGQEIASMDITTDEEGIPFVSMVSVASAAERRGIATLLYREAFRLVDKRYGQQLHSDVERSGATDAFWQKQVHEGNAVCMRKVRAASKNVAFDRIVKGRSGCERYRMTRKP